jgi:hypothetical protein
MASKRVQDIVDRFVADLMSVANEEAVVSLQDRLRGILGGAAVPAVSAAPAVIRRRRRRRKTTRGYTVLKPCPIPECKETAAPRWGMVCKGHGATLSREDILVARDNANKPGGIWADLKSGRQVS